MKYNNQKIIDTYQYQIFSTYAEALQHAITEFNWSEDDIIEDKSKVSFLLEDRDIIDTQLDCIYIDSGSDDYLYYLEYERKVSINEGTMDAIILDNKYTYQDIENDLANNPESWNSVLNNDMTFDRMSESERDQMQMQILTYAKNNC